MDPALNRGLEWHSGSKIHLLPAQMGSPWGRALALNLGQLKCKGWRLMIRSCKSQGEKHPHNARCHEGVGTSGNQCNKEVGYEKAVHIPDNTGMCISFFLFLFSQYGISDMKE